MLFVHRMSSSNTSLRWKKKPLIIFFTACLCLVVLVTIFPAQPAVPKHLKPVNRGFNQYKERNPQQRNRLSNDGLDVKQNLQAQRPDTRRMLNRRRQAEENQVGYIEWDEPRFKTNPKRPGERGVPVKIFADESAEIKEAYEEYGFNQYVSDKISLHRALPDIRPIICHGKKYQEKLPRVSVIVIFHNEGWSTLLRTVHTVLDRTPPKLLEEVLIVDDFSDKEHLKTRLEKYVNTLSKVKIVRTKQREGLIRARVIGADQSRGEVLLFLDSHCEVNAGWLPPLLSPIEKNYKTVVCPIIDIIDHRTFSYKSGHAWTRGTFSWRFDYKERSILARQYLLRKDESDGVPSPVMAGGLFAISKIFWEELGKYDPELYVWGGEQYELSFKLWMCGGQMFNMPCSRVGHVYRYKVPYKSNKVNAALINFKRVAEVWMDDFKDFLYHYRPDIGYQDHGNVSERIALRKRLKCKSFKWYLENVANDTVRTRYEPDRAVGQVINVGSKLCMDFSGTFDRTKNNPIRVSECPKEELDKKRSEVYWTYIYELRYGTEMCAEGDLRQPNQLLISRCHETKGDQEFLYDQGSRQILHRATKTCLEQGSLDNIIYLKPCDKNSLSQQWEMELKDIYGPVPDWAKVAYNFDKNRPKSKKNEVVRIDF